MTAATNALAAALRPHVSAPHGDPAEDVARNVATVLGLDDGSDAYLVIHASLTHRVRLGWISVGDIECAAAEGARAWNREIARAA